MYLLIITKLICIALYPTMKGRLKVLLYKKKTCCSKSELIVSPVSIASHVENNMNAVSIHALYSFVEPL